jgi:hypothetical protein
MSNQVLIVTGMHRSGTSMIARFVHHSGISMGDNLMGKHESNPYGHYEDMDFYDFQRAIIRRQFGDEWIAPGPPMLSAGDEEMAREIIAARGHKAHWGWKDPRTCLFLDLWDRLLPSAHYLFIVREPAAVVDSLSRRGRLKFHQYRTHKAFFEQYLVYNRSCLDFHLQHRGRSVLVVLENVITRPEEFVRLISSRFEYEFSLERFLELYDAAALKGGGQIRHLWLSPLLLARCLRLYARLQRSADL